MPSSLNVVVAAVWTVAALNGDSRNLENPNIDMPGFLRTAIAAADHRETRRVSEDDFIKMSREPGTIVLDARSKEKYDLLHIRGAVHLSFSDITIESLARVIPDKDTRILIYCNNNFENADDAFPTKRFSAALNLSTYLTLFDYGYRNVFELGPLLDPATSKLEFEPVLASDAATEAANSAD
jgi:hypothetical protein